MIARPLRRMADVAAAVDAGDLSLRAGGLATGGEVGVLARAFDRMLARLERAFTSQRDFVSDASHELRTPLAVLRAQVELLDREFDEPHHHQAALTLLRRLDEIDRLVSDMLTLAGAESGRLIEPRPIELEDYFEDLRRDLPLFGERDFHVAAVGGLLLADPDRLTQVLRNLVRNAVVHTTPEGRISVTRPPKRGLPGDRDHRRRGGHHAGAPRAHLRALLPRRGEPLARQRRQRPRAGDRPCDRRGARRAHRGGVQARLRHDDPHRAAGLPSARPAVREL